MSREHGPRPDSSHIEREAVAWVQKASSGDAEPKDIDAARRWRAQSPLHAKAYEDAERVWKRMGVVGRAHAGAGADFVGPLREFGRQRAAMNRRMVLGGGAVAIGVASLYGALNPPFGLWPSVSELAADYRTGTGEQRTIRFADDVAIDLNTQTSLAVRPATATEDCIELIGGEASFAAQRSTRTLAVLAARGRVVSEGGRFDVRYIATGADAPVSVTCFEGRVRVELQDNVTELGPGQRVRYDGGRLSEAAAIDPIVASEWRRGIVEFRNMPLVDAIEEINRYRPGRIVLMSSPLGQRLLSGRFRIDQMDKVLLQLEHVFNAKLQRLPGGIVILS
ncbi:FecR domain-containing protein [Microbacteriaceae bacterium K1510]|nr:FecR domain-containing protein [Microbacteriaceae bacterium K1510]